MNLEIKRRAFKHHVSMESEDVLPDEPELLKEVKEEVEVARRLSMVRFPSVAEEEDAEQGEKVGGERNLMEVVKEVEEEMKSVSGKAAKGSETGVAGADPGVPAENLESGETGKDDSGAQGVGEKADVGGSSGDSKDSLLEKDVASGDAAKIVEADAVVSGADATVPAEKHEGGEAEKSGEDVKTDVGVLAGAGDGSDSALKKDATGKAEIADSEASKEAGGAVKKVVETDSVVSEADADVPAEKHESGDAEKSGGAAKKIAQADVEGSTGDINGPLLEKEVATGDAAKIVNADAVVSGADAGVLAEKHESGEVGKEAAGLLEESDEAAEKIVKDEGSNGKDDGIGLAHDKKVATGETAKIVEADAVVSGADTGVPAEKLESGEAANDAGDVGSSNGDCDSGAGGALVEAVKKVAKAVVGGLIGDDGSSLKTEVATGETEGDALDGAVEKATVTDIGGDGDVGLPAEKLESGETVEKEADLGGTTEDGSGAGSALKKDIATGESEKSSDGLLNQESVGGIQKVAEKVNEAGGSIGAREGPGSALKKDIATGESEKPSVGLLEKRSAGAIQKIKEADLGGGSNGDGSGPAPKRVTFAPGTSSHFEPIPFPPEVTAQQWEAVLAVWKAHEEKLGGARRDGASGASDKNQLAAEKRHQFYQTVKEKVAADQILEKEQKPGVASVDPVGKKEDDDYAARKKKEFFDRVASLVTGESAISACPGQESEDAAKNADAADFGGSIGGDVRGSKDFESADLPPECAPIKSDVVFKTVRELVDPGHVLETHLKRHHFISSVQEKVSADQEKEQGQGENVSDEKAVSAASVAQKRMEFHQAVQNVVAGGSGSSGDGKQAGTSTMIEGSDSEHSIGEREDGHDGDVDTDGSFAGA